MASAHSEIIISTGPAPLVTALHLSDTPPSLSILSLYSFSAERNLRLGACLATT